MIQSRIDAPSRMIALILTDRRRCGLVLKGSFREIDLGALRLQQRTFRASCECRERAAYRHLWWRHLSYSSKIRRCTAAVRLRAHID